MQTVLRLIEYANKYAKICSIKTNRITNMQTVLRLIE